MKNSKVFLLFPLFVSLMASCHRDEEISFATKYEEIRFSVCDSILASGSIETKALENEITCDITDWEYVEDSTATKASLTQTLSDSVGVFGYNFTTWSSSVKPMEKMYDMKNTIEDGELIPVKKVLWKDCTSGYLRFYSYAPYGKFTLSSESTGGVPYLTYTVPTTNKEQIDVLYAQSADVTCSTTDRPTIPLQFKHAMTAVQFRLGIDGATLKKVTISGVYSKGKLSLDGTWSDQTTTASYSVAHKDSLLIMVPQTVPSGATIELQYNDGSSDKTISASIAGQVWPAGKKVVYTLKNASGGETDYIYFDLAAGRIRIGNESDTDASYSGYVYVNGTAKEVYGTHKGTNKYYVYQSSSSNKGSTGYANDTEYNANKNIANHVCRVPSYPELKVGDKKWREYITNNQNLADIIDKWKTLAGAAGREKSDNYIIVTAVKEEDKNVEIVLDNIWMNCYQVRLDRHKAGTITYDKIKTVTYGDIQMWAKLDSYSSAVKTQAKFILKGDNRLMHMFIPGNKNISATFTSFQGDGFEEGSLLAAPTEKFTNIIEGVSVLGSNDGNYSSDGYKGDYTTLTFNGGTIFASDGLMSSNGTDNDEIMNNEKWCWSVIGGGGNINSYVNINGGTITALAHSTGAAIGGGGGHIAQGGWGNVTIKGGRTFAYSYGVYSMVKNTFVPITAIGGGGSVQSVGNSGTVTIENGYVYAQSRGGCAIGGSNSPSNPGGSGTVTIEGGEIYAKSVGGSIKNTSGTVETIKPGVAIGGGNGTTGGNATVTINRGKCYTGSVGGGKSVSGGYIGSAVVNIDGGEFSGQFIMAKGAATAPTFTMSGGTIKNSSTSSTDFPKVQPNGGAVYMEEGTCSINNGTISKCSGTLGGAVYMNGGTFTMSGTGKISDCKGEKDGGAVYIEGGSATISGGQIYKNIASKGNGGGLYISGGDFHMPASGTGEILNNAADTDPVKVGDTYYGGNGGGIYVRSTEKDVIVDILSGTVQYNAADRNGGGLCVDMEGSSKTATITIGTVGGTKANPDIQFNSAALSGGGMAVQGNGSNIVINSGTIKGNVSAFVKNEDIRNDGGLVELVGKNIPGQPDQVDVKYNTITFYANNGNDPEPYDEQRVITSTNSILQPTATALAFEKEFYHIASWNTKRDGTGTGYKTDGGGAIMNITSDVSLYAQWVANQ